MPLNLVLNHIGVATTSVILVLFFCLQSYTAWKRHRLNKLVNEGLRNGKRYRLKAAFAPVGTQQRIIYIFGLAMSVLLVIRSIDPLARFAFDDGWLRLLTFNTGSLLMVGALISLRSQLRLWIVMKRKDIAYWSRNVFRFLGVMTILLTNVCFFLFIGLPSSSANWGFVAYFVCVMILETAMVLVWNFIVYQLKRSVAELKRPRPEMRIEPQEANELDTYPTDGSGPNRTRGFSHVVSKPLSDTNSPRDDHAHHSRLSNGSAVQSHNDSHEHVLPAVQDMPIAQSSSSGLLSSEPTATSDTAHPSAVVLSVAQPPVMPSTVPSLSLVEKGTVVEDRSFLPLTRAPSLTSTSLQSYEGATRRKSFFGRKTSTAPPSEEATTQAMQKLRKFHLIVHVCWAATMVYQGFAIKEALGDTERKAFVFPQDMYPMYACIISGVVCLWYGWQRNTFEVFRLKIDDVIRTMDEEEQSREAPHARAPPNYSAEGGSRSGRNGAAESAGATSLANGKEAKIPVTFSALHGTGGHAVIAEQGNDSNSLDASKDSFGNSSFT